MNATIGQSICALTICAALCLGGTSAAAATYHLAPGGDDAGPGSEAQPWATLEHASEVAGPGDVVVFAPGEYAGQLQPQQSGEPGAPITFRAAERHQAVLTSPGGEHSVVLQDVANIRLAGLAFAPSDNDAMWLIAERAESIELVDLMMRGPARSNAVRLVECSDVRISDCTMLGGISGNMVHITDSARIVFEGCEISGSPHALLLFLPDRTNQQVVLRGNVFAGRTGRTILVDSVDHLLFENNVIVRGLDGGRSADSRFGFFVSNSIFRGSRVFDNWGTRLFAISPYRDTLDFNRVRVYNNVFHGNSADAVTVSNHENVFDAIFANNVFADNDPFGSGRQIRIIEGNTPEDVQFVSNLIDGNVQIGDDLHEASEAGESELFGATVAGAPQFTDPATWEHVPAEGSPLIDGGTFLTRATADGEGQRLEVEDAQWFYDGFGISGEVGDVIAVSSAENVACVVRADYEADVLELDRPLQWSAGDPVSLPWAGEGPEVGVFEVGSTRLTAPVVVANPANPAPGEPVLLRAVMPASAPDASVRWQLSDGTLLEGAEVEHTFATEGEFGVRVRVEGADGEVVRAAGLVVVEQPRGEDEPLLRSTFGPEDGEWWWRWHNYRPGRTQWAAEETEDGWALHVSTPEDRQWMPCRTNPREWDIDRDPFITVRYRISAGTPVGAYVEAFPSHEGTRRVWLAGTDSAMPLPGGREDARRLVDDGEWHTLQLDARAIRDQWPDVNVAQRFAFEGQWETARDDVTAGDEFWLAEVTIGPAYAQ
ncbi:MAG: PKD domain-containing protein [Armatimonadota bacterium]